MLGFTQIINQKETTKQRGKLEMCTPEHDRDIPKKKKKVKKEKTYKGLSTEAAMVIIRYLRKCIVENKAGSVGRGLLALEFKKEYAKCRCAIKAFENGAYKRAEKMIRHELNEVIKIEERIGEQFSYSAYARSLHALEPALKEVQEALKKQR